MKGRGVRIQIGAGSIQVDAEVDHFGKRIGLPVESGKD